jgi:4-hydroxy-4-methyl-2-oxoglutarate aldolase
MLQACAQAVDFKVGHHFGEGQVSPGDILIADGNGVVVVPKDEGAVILEKAQRLLETEHLLLEKIKAGATIGELINVDGVFETVFSYQDRAMENR